jgi:uncharacterized protein (TIGR02996 family)
VDEREQLLAAIAAEPETLDNWIVYADWLSDRGDPRGELIAIELALEAGTAGDEAQARHRALVRDEDALLSPRLAAQAKHLWLEWWRGFVRGAEVMFGPIDDPPTREVLAALFADPHACMLRRLALGRRADLIEAALSCASVHELTLRDVTQTELPLAEAFPNLDSLVLERGAFTIPELALARLVHPRLRHIDGKCPALRTGNFDLPNLESIEVVIDPVDYFDEGIFAKPPPRLSRLVASGSVELVRRLRTSRLVSQLRVLSIGVDRHTLEELAVEPGAFRHIALELDVWADAREEGEAMLARLGALFPDAKITVHEEWA